MTRRFLSLLALVVALVVAAPVARAQTKIGFADPEVILQNMPQMTQARQTLQTEYQQRQQALETQAQTLRTKAEDYQRRQSLLTAEARTAAEQELSTLQTALQTASQQAEQALAQREAALMRPIYESLQNAIDAEAAAKGLDLVLPTRVANQPNILFVNRDRVTDITLDVARRLGINPNTPAATEARPGVAAPAGVNQRPVTPAPRPAQAPRPTTPARRGNN